MTEAYLIEALRSHGLKVTPQRHLICQLIAQAQGEHPSAEMLYEQAARVMPTLSLKTVYTTVSELAQIGAVRLDRFGTENLRVDTYMAPHAHAVCQECGRLKDMPIDDKALAALREAVGDSTFQVDNCEVIYRGLCEHCSETKCANNGREGWRAGWQEKNRYGRKKRRCI